MPIIFCWYTWRNEVLARINELRNGVRKYVQFRSIDQIGEKVKHMYNVDA